MFWHWTHFTSIPIYSFFQNTLATLPLPMWLDGAKVNRTPGFIHRAILPLWFYLITPITIIYSLPGKQVEKLSHVFCPLFDTHIAVIGLSTYWNACQLSLCGHSKEIPNFYPIDIVSSTKSKQSFLIMSDIKTKLSNTTADVECWIYRVPTAGFSQFTALSSN